MNKKKKLVNKKHRKTKDRLKILNDASLAKAKKKVIIKPKEEVENNVETPNVAVKKESTAKKKTATKKTTAKKKTATKKTTAKKKTATKKTTAKK